MVAIGISFGGMYGYAINPARDLGPRLFAVLAGFKNNGLTSGDPGTVYNTMAWLPPVLGPLVGGILGAVAYDLMIGRALMRANELPRPHERHGPLAHRTQGRAHQRRGRSRNPPLTPASALRIPHSASLLRIAAQRPRNPQPATRNFPLPQHAQIHPCP